MRLWTEHGTDNHGSFGLSGTRMMIVMRTSLEGDTGDWKYHGARSRPIIHLERSASASPLEFAPDPAPLRAAFRSFQLSLTVPARFKTTLLACGCTHATPRPHSCAHNNPLIGLLSRIPRARYAWRTWFPAVLLAAAAPRWWRTTLLRNHLHQLHRLPATRATQNCWHGWRHHWRRSDHQAVPTTAGGANAARACASTRRLPTRNSP